MTEGAPALDLDHHVSSWPLCAYRHFSFFFYLPPQPNKPTTITQTTENNESNRTTFSRVHFVHCLLHWPDVYQISHVIGPQMVGFYQRSMEDSIEEPNQSIAHSAQNGRRRIDITGASAFAMHTHCICNGITQRIQLVFGLSVRRTTLLYTLQSTHTNTQRQTGKQQRRIAEPTS